MKDIFKILLDDLNIIGKIKPSSFGYKERMKIERNLFLILRGFCKAIKDYDVTGFTEWNRNEITLEIDGKNDVEAMAAINEIFNLKFFLQQLSSESAYVRGDILSKLGGEQPEVSLFIRGKLNFISEKIEKIRTERNLVFDDLSEEPINRILILGAAGTGTTSMGEKLGEKLKINHIDSDDLYWLPSDPPYNKPRSKENLKLMIELELLRRKRWVLSGSPCGWGNEIMSTLDFVVFLVVPVEIRIARLREREENRFGKDIYFGGKRYDAHMKFINWAENYDNGKANGRTKYIHQRWLTQLDCPVLCIDGAQNLEGILERIINTLRDFDR